MSAEAQCDWCNHFTDKSEFTSIRNKEKGFWCNNKIVEMHDLVCEECLINYLEEEKLDCIFTEHYISEYYNNLDLDELKRAVKIFKEVSHGRKSI
jgi:hypothetical protein